MNKFQVNIALKSNNRYYHWATVQLHDGIFEDEAIRRFDILVQKFPPVDGWHLTLSVWQNTGRDIKESYLQ